MRRDYSCLIADDPTRPLRGVDVTNWLDNAGVSCTKDCTLMQKDGGEPITVSDFAQRLYGLLSPPRAIEPARVRSEVCDGTRSANDNDRRAASSDCTLIGPAIFEPDEMLVLSGKTQADKGSC